MDDPIKADTVVFIIQMRQPGCGGGGVPHEVLEKLGLQLSHDAVVSQRIPGKTVRSRTQDVKCSMKEANITKETNCAAYWAFHCCEGDRTILE